MISLMVALALTTSVERDIGVPAGRPWTHAATGLILAPGLAGLPRTALTDATHRERDVTVRFEAPDHSERVTLYVFHPPIANVGLWFDSAQAALAAGDTFRNAVPVAAVPISFAAGSGRAGSSLRQTYRTLGGRYRSTALAVLPVGGWLVELRMSATTLTAGQLDARVRQVIGAIGWPSHGATAVATPVKPCGRRPRGWCREGEAREDYSVYRSAARPGYVLALNDTGGIASVAPTVRTDATKRYAVSLEDVDGTVTRYPSLAAPPSPKQVWDMIGSDESIGATTGVRAPLDGKSGNSVP